MKFKILAFITYFIAAALGALILALCWFENGNMWELIGTGIAFFVSFYLFAALHELGHMLFGAISGVRAKPVKLFTFYEPCSCEIIPKTDKGLKGRLIVTTLGGVAVNCFFVILGIVALAVSAVPTCIAMVLPASLYLFIVNLAPFTTDSGKTDGLVLAELIRGDDEAKVMLAVLTVQAQLLNGKLIEEVDEKLLFDLPQIQEDDPAFISLTELRAEYFVAKGDTENAQKYQSRFEQLKEDYLN